MEGVAFALSVISTCIDLAQSIDSLIQKFKHAQSELQEGLRTVASTRKVLSHFRQMFESSCLPQELLEDYLDDIRPLHSELEIIQRFLNVYLPLCSRGGLAGLAWRYRWGKEIDRHQKNLVQLNRHLNCILATLSFKVGFLALEAIHIGAPAQNENLSSSRFILQRAFTKDFSINDSADHPPRPQHNISEGKSSATELRRGVRSRFSKAGAKDIPPTVVIEENLFAIGRRYLEAAQDLRSREFQYSPPINQIQYAYKQAARALQDEEWNGSFRSSQIALAVERVM